jgi:flagellar biosynthetic protein FlhB
MESQEQDRSEQPTAFKLQRARLKGAVARGTDLGFLTSLVAFVGFAWVMGPEVGRRLMLHSATTLGEGTRLADGDGALMTLAARLFASAIGPLLFFAAVVFGLVLLFEIVQTGVVFSSQPLKPDFSRLNPAKGLKRLFSIRLLIEATKNVAKLAVYAVLAWLLARSALNDDVARIEDGHTLANRLGVEGLRLLAAAAGVAFMFAVIDQIISRRDFTRKMRMSRRELKREHREREGEPRLKQKRKALHAEFVKMSRSLRGLRGADMLVVNPVHFAVGLRYDPRTMAAPTVVSMGRDRFALRLRRTAFLYGVTVIEDRPLAQLGARPADRRSLLSAGRRSLQPDASPRRRGRSGACLRAFCRGTRISCWSAGSSRSCWCCSRRSPRRCSTC